MQLTANIFHEKEEDCVKGLIQKLSNAKHFNINILHPKTCISRVSGDMRYAYQEITVC